MELGYNYGCGYPVPLAPRNSDLLVPRAHHSKDSKDSKETSPDFGADTEPHRALPGTGSQLRTRSDAPQPPKQLGSTQELRSQILDEVTKLDVKPSWL